MKKGLIMLVLFLLVGCESILTETPNVKDRVDSRDGQETKTDSGMPSNYPSAKQTIRVSEEQVTRGNLVLVNKDHPLDPEAVPKDIVTLFEYNDLMYGYVVLDNTIRLSRSVAENFGDMIEAAGQDGVNHFMISSGYRNESEQEQLYREKGSDYALPPGYSEHNLGLSMDIGSTQQSIDRSPEGKWLKEHAWAHGFILRYPQDKTEITGIQYEPWHFRYVGQPHSMIMKELNLTLEEYLDYLKEQSSYRTTVEGKEYEIKYVPVTSKDMEIEIPAGSEYEISGNNIDGIIVTVRLNKDDAE
ncbi:M15 family metallopeptidase [Virgibacillus sp. LDC1]|uniref:M15 family metallopeptidase n=1 Tax=Paenibacillus sp. GM2FR TaxID=2059268 RepID=UPI000C2744AF|nr:M15 family metallopeptidase [Paenibacillus sp. GM2FR]MCV4230515.1 M15 family metallopeptidase [Virgibacillus sp. LDC1]PJN54317.1 D-alanyl-D-alanine carboxypeptidase [Paenibacillus sp. GM2FR]